jgi:hypothetical protein
MLGYLNNALQQAVLFEYGVATSLQSFINA